MNTKFDLYTHQMGKGGHIWCAIRTTVQVPTGCIPYSSKVDPTAELGYTRSLGDLLPCRGMGFASWLLVFKCKIEKPLVMLKQHWRLQQ